MIFESGTIVVSYTRRGSIGYRAPELTGRTEDVYGASLPGLVTRKSDIWAIGIMSLIISF
jgi:serine/threonine protein kinase